MHCDFVVILNYEVLWKGRYSTQLQKRNVRSMSQMKIKNKTPIKLRLAYISKKSIPSEAFQPEDRPAELTVKEGIGLGFIYLFFNFRQTLEALKKQKTPKQNKTKKP